MPSRTDEERQLIDSLSEKEPDYYCNARTGNPDRPYCRMRAGFRTDHVGEGRCHIHGGRAGRPIVHGLYSKKLRAELRAEYEKAIQDPQMIDLYGELAIVRVLFGDFINDLEMKREKGTFSWTEITPKGTPMVSPEAKILTQLVDTLGRLYERILKAEEKAGEHLTLKQVHLIIKQIANTMGVCGECPIRIVVGANIKDIRTEPIRTNNN